MHTRPGGLVPASSAARPAAHIRQAIAAAQAKVAVPSVQPMVPQSGRIGVGLPPPQTPGVGGGRSLVVQAFYVGGAAPAGLAGSPGGDTESGGAIRLTPGMLERALVGAGQPLPAAVQAKMEALFCADFSDVRVHLGPAPAALGAVAFTVGSDLYVSPTHYAPLTVHGQRLLAHELTHVVQQRAGRVHNPFGSGAALVQHPGLEAEAQRMSLRAALPSSASAVRPAPARHRHAGTVQPAATASVTAPRPAGTAAPADDKDQGEADAKAPGGRNRPSAKKRQKLKALLAAAKAAVRLLTDEKKLLTDEKEREELGSFYPAASTGGVQAQGVLTLVGEAKPYDTGIYTNGAAPGYLYYAQYATAPLARADAEVKVLSALTAMLYENRKYPRARDPMPDRGELVLHSTRGPCSSCRTVIEQFKRDHPNVVIKVVYRGETAQTNNATIGGRDGYATATKTVAGWLQQI